MVAVGPNFIFADIKAYTSQQFVYFGFIVPLRVVGSPARDFVRYIFPLARCRDDSHHENFRVASYKVCTFQSV